MVALKENFWNFRAGDNIDRSHVPPTPYWISIIRVAQLLLALLILILTAVAASDFGVAWSSAGLTWFTFVLTLIHIGWLTLSILLFPIAYNYWAQLGMEIGCVIFWLASWATLASDASALGTVTAYNGFGVFVGVDPKYKTAVDCVKASAGLGALEWLLFIATLVFFVISLIQYRKAKAPATGTTGVEAGAVEPKTDHELSQVQQQAPPQQYVQQDQYGSQIPPQQYQQAPPPQGYPQQQQPAPYPQQ